MDNKKENTSESKINDLDILKQIIVSPPGICVSIEDIRNIINSNENEKK